MHRAPGRRSLAGIAAICLVGVAAALILQPVGCNQTAHLGLVKALTDGTPRIDAYAAETCDTAYIDGHYYAAKAVLVLLVAALGLAAWSLPRVVFTRRDVVLALVAFGTWVVLAHAAPDLLELDRAVDQVTGLATVVALLAVAVLAWLAAARVGPAAAAGVLLLAALLAPGVSSHSKWALLVVLASGAIVGLSFTRMAPRT